MEKQTQYGSLREFYSINQIQMQTRGVGVKKSKSFADVIYGSSLMRAVGAVPEVGYRDTAMC